MFPLSRPIKSLTQISPPSINEVKVADLFDRVKRLYKPRMDAIGIQFSIYISHENLTIEADLELIEQVLINLLLNAIDAVEGHESPHIRLKCSTKSKWTSLYSSC